jgi:hypothetical protein
MASTHFYETDFQIGGKKVLVFAAYTFSAGSPAHYIPDEVLAVIGEQVAAARHDWETCDPGDDGADASSSRLSVTRPKPDGADGEQGWRVPSSSDWWSVEPDVGRVAHGVPSRVDRLKGIGNAVVPQIPEIIGRAIMKIEQ